MRSIRLFAAGFLIIVSASILSAQDNKVSNLAAAPPNLVVLLHQEIQQGKTTERQKLESAISRACDRLETPSHWIDLQSLTGAQEALFFDPFDSFEDLGKSKIEWGQFFTAHPELARMQEEIEGLVASDRTIIAARRNDLGYLADSIDLSEARYMRVLDIRLFPGHENDFIEAIKILADAYAKIQADTPWVVYQVDVGVPTPAFLVFMPMPELKPNDDLLSWRANLVEAEGEQAADTFQRIAREAFASTETNLYAVRPEMSHVSKEFAANDPEFWTHYTMPDPVPADIQQKAKQSATH
ncbi:MAG: hypothetical protein DMG30_00655 [Acidobacteria bacterium]|nr:MAG: hypothetical protein DMG30_00655 [Acidobacteriota bacterium]